jgi:hypothetical protein
MRIVQERLEAANALKKQMWAEAQLDKRRMKEEFVMRTQYSSFTGNKMELNLTISASEGRQSPMVNVDDRSNGMSVNASFQQERSSDQQSDMNYRTNMSSEGNMQMQDLSADTDNLPYQQTGHANEKSRSQLKSVIGHRAEEMYVYRSLPLGQDRRRNRYWQFTTSASRNDPGCGRIFVELHDGRWRLIDYEEVFYFLNPYASQVSMYKSDHLCTLMHGVDFTMYVEHISSLFKFILNFFHHQTMASAL